MDDRLGDLSALPGRRIGVTETSRCTLGGISASNWITPGATVFTEIFGARALASVRVMWITPAFEAQ